MMFMRNTSGVGGVTCDSTYEKSLSWSKDVHNEFSTRIRSIYFFFTGSNITRRKTDVPWDGWTAILRCLY